MSPCVIQVQKPQQAEHIKEDETKDGNINMNKIDEQQVVEIYASTSMTQILEKQRVQKTDVAKARTTANSYAGNASGHNKLGNCFCRIEGKNQGYKISWGSYHDLC